MPSLPRPTESPAIGLERDEKHLYRWNGGPWVPGVTSIVKMLGGSDALINWAKKETAASAVRNHDLVGQLIASGGPDSAIDWLKRIPDYIKDAAADMGSKVHYYAEMLGSGGTLPDIAEQEALRTQSYIDWERANRPEFVHVEFMVYNEKWLYGGTGDVFLRLPVCPAKGCGKKNCLWLIDYKTGNGIYESSAMQLCALQRGEFMGYKGDPKQYEIPQADHYGILHITNAGARLVEYQVRESEWEAFRACRRLYTWQHSESKDIKIRA